MKKYYIQHNGGSIEYLVNHHDGEKKHNDGSEFFDVATFKSKKKLNQFIDKLTQQGYRPC